jgi:hypothetical protein
MEPGRSIYQNLDRFAKARYTQGMVVCPSVPLQLARMSMETTPPKSEPVQILFSYARRDEALRDELEKYLGPLKRSKRIVCWHDRHIGAGHTWSHEISVHLQTADIILLLVSADFLASNYCNTVEVSLALQRHARGEARVIPVILRPADWMSESFARLQALPHDALPVVEWPNRDAAFYNIARGIKKVIEEIEALRAASA